MKIAASISALLHGLLLLAVLVHWRSPPAAPDEVPGKIEMVFGRNALQQGAPARAAKPAVPVPPPTAADPAAAMQSAPLPAGATKVRVAPVAAPPAAASPVRLGDGLVGFDVPAPDPGIVQAQSDPFNRPPRYPDGAWARREHGRVVLRIHVRPDGLVGGIETLQSSGFADLDEAAIGAARRWRFIPQLRDGKPVASSRDQAMDFILE